MMSAMDKKMNKKMMSASASPLPRTGGTPLLPLLSAGALALMAGSGLLAARLVRRSS
jgi:LPXTG-motif cell wall-anchored protein